MVYISNVHKTSEPVEKEFLCLLEQKLDLQTAKQFASLAAAVKRVELNPNMTVGSSLLIESNLTLDRGYDSSRGNGGLQERRQEKGLARARFGVDSEVGIQDLCIFISRDWKVSKITASPVRDSSQISQDHCSFFQIRGRRTLDEHAHYYFSPCIMCSGTALLHNIPRIVIGENQVRLTLHRSSVIIAVKNSKTTLLILTYTSG